MGRLLTATSATGVGLLLASCAVQGGAAASAPEEDYRVSVEIPLGAMHVAEGDVLKVDELLDERTSFDAEDFLLDEVVLIARSNGDAAANAELLVVEWRSGQVAIPAGGEDDWYEVRLPAPEEDLGGAWLLDIVGDATVDLVAVVLEPRPRLVAEARTVYRTTTVYRPARPVREVFWIYDPDRYYVYHYYGTWPYRYFIGPWSYRYYDLAYRPHRYHYGPLFRPAHWRDGWRRGRHAHRDPAGPRPAALAPRRIAPELAQLRRTHPRLRGLSRLSRRPATPGTDVRRAPSRRSQAQARTPTDAEPRAERRTIRRRDATADARPTPTRTARTLRRPRVSRDTPSTTRATTRSPRPARSAAAAPNRGSATMAAPRAQRRFERTAPASRPTPNANVVRRGDRPAAAGLPRAASPTPRPGASRSVPTVRSPRAAPRRGNVQRSQPVARDRARRTPPPHSVRSQPSGRPQRAEPRRPAALSRSTPRSRPQATQPAPVRRAQAPRVRERVERAPARGQPATRPGPSERPARSTRQAPSRGADDAPASDPRARRFERR